MLRLTTFGGLALRDEHGGEPSPAVQRRPRAVLALLATTGQQGLSRDKLLTYFWPESDQEHGRNALRQLIHVLRRDAGSRDLLVGTTELRLNPELITSDVADFDQALKARQLDQVAALYTGPFLDGFHLGAAPEFEEWADRQRDRYLRDAVGALERLATAADARHDAQSALAYWHQLVGLDPLNSRYAVGYMQALAAAGNVSRAIQHARVYEELIKGELGGPPDPAVVELARRFREQPSAPSAVDAGPRPVGPEPTQRSEPRGDALRRRVALALADRYQVEQELPRAEGAARAYIARDRQHDRRVWLRVLHPALASRLDTSRFIREITLTARLQHPAILPLLASGDVEGQPWYVTPWEEGETLRDRLNRERTLGIADALRLTGEVSGALDYAHRQGIVHRDVRPENILLVEGHALVMNFGVARALDMAAGEDLTLSGAFIGQPGYMSPEQMTATGPPDPRGDVYSLGCVLYEMLTGEPLYSGPTPQAIIAKRQHGRVLPPRMLRRDIPQALERAVLKAISARPEERFGSAAEFAAALLSGEQTSPSGAASPLTTGFWRRAGATVGWRSVLALGLVALLLAGAAGLVCARP